MRRRTRAREAAMQFLYQLDLREEREPVGLEDFLEDAEAQGHLKDREGRDFTRTLVVGALRHREEIDKILRRVARNWNLERMAAVDRNVLRMAVYELLHCHDVPPKVTINEAIEIAKRYSTANSGGFVNGIIDRIRIDHEAGRLHGDSPASDPTPQDPGSATPASPSRNPES